MSAAATPDYDLDALLAASRCFGQSTIFGWTLDATLTVPLALVLVLYVAGTARLWVRAGGGHGNRYWQVGCFAIGWAALVLALLSPLHAASKSVFTAHMIEHEILMAVAAPLLVLARPLPVMLWALPAAWRGMVGRLPKAAWFAALWAVMTMPLLATILHGVAIWLWHVPRVFEAALSEAPLHWLQHLSYLGSALLFWWALFGTRHRDDYGAAIGHLFATAGHTGLLGLLLLLSTRAWFPMQGSGAAAWGLTPIEDQQLAGLVMWIPAGMVYAGAALVLAGLWISQDRDKKGPTSACRQARSAMRREL
jgi:putative membrane protein